MKKAGQLFCLFFLSLIIGHFAKTHFWTSVVALLLMTFMALLTYSVGYEEGKRELEDKEKNSE